MNLLCRLRIHNWNMLPRFVNIMDDVYQICLCRRDKCGAFGFKRVNKITLCTYPAIDELKRIAKEIMEEKP